MSRLPAHLRWWTIARPVITLTFPDARQLRFDFPIHSKGGDDVTMRVAGGISELAGWRDHPKVRQQAGFYLDIRLRWSASIPGKVRVAEKVASTWEDRDATEVAAAVAAIYDAILVDKAGAAFRRQPDTTDEFAVTAAPKTSFVIQDEEGFDRDVVLALTTTHKWEPVVATSGTAWALLPVNP